uniref:Putative secreted protein n=1 Tax=Ixodes ricinus TaxID=34613 RepID=A0A6B0TRQ6_IXORI
MMRVLLVAVGLLPLASNSLSAASVRELPSSCLMFPFWSALGNGKPPEFLGSLPYEPSASGSAHFRAATF